MPDPAQAAPVQVAIVGMGTVGTGVARVLVENPERMARRSGRPVRLRHAVVRDLKKSRGLELAQGILTELSDAAAPGMHDASTTGLIRHLRFHRN